MEKKRARLEEENEELRQRLIETELAKQVLQTELERPREVRVLSYLEGPGLGYRRTAALNVDAGEAVVQRIQVTPSSSLVTTLPLSRREDDPTNLVLISDSNTSLK